VCQETGVLLLLTVLPYMQAYCCPITVLLAQAQTAPPRTLEQRLQLIEEVRIHLRLFWGAARVNTQTQSHMHMGPGLLLSRVL
jgi:hypothetical protein